MNQLSKILGWDYLDAQKVVESIELAEFWGIEVEDIREWLQEDERTLDVNAWIYQSLDSVLFGFTGQAVEYYKEKYPRILEKFNIEEKAEEFRDENKPYVNYVDSHFNSILDDYDMHNKEESFKSFLKYLINN